MAVAIPLIAAIIAAGGGIASAEISGSNQKKAQKAAADAATEQEAQRLKDEQALAASNAPQDPTMASDPAAAQTVRDRVSKLASQTQSGVDPSFYGLAIKDQNPSYSGLVDETVNSMVNNPQGFA